MRHNIPDAGGHRVGIDDAFDHGAVVRLISARESAGGPERCFTRCGPHGEVGHARQVLQTNPRESLQAMRYGVEQRASERRFASPINGNIRKIARSAKSGRLMTSSMPFKIVGRAA